MAVVRNLMLRIGADFSPARKELQGATRDLNRFKKDTEKTTSTISGKKGLAGIGAEFRSLGNTVSASLSRIRGAKGIGGITSELRTLRPVMSSATRGLGALGAGAAGAGAAFGGAALGVGAFVAGLALATVGISKASQEAVKFEADIGRLNISLREGSRSYVAWARAQGLAKQSAVELGATYGNLLGSFMSDAKELQQSTQDLVHATRVISSYTGRSLDDVFNRIRSGMLGSTEAIEDLGVYVNISMIESTKAFRRFAKDKSWSELDFQTQQQIRLAAILEQTYARYGNQLQNNVMTKQELMTEQFKDIKLHLSQAFLPVWDSVLPALQAFGNKLADVTERIARFMYSLRGWDYDEMTQGTDQQTSAVTNQGDAYDDLADSAKAARKELASFDRLNLIGRTGASSGGGGGGGSGGLGGFAPTTGNPRPITFDIEWPEIPLELTKRRRIEFDPPRPPDAGAGAVATAVVSTVNRMAKNVAEATAKMWRDLHLQSQTGGLAQVKAWLVMTGNIGQAVIPSLKDKATTEWRSMWDQLVADSVAGVIRVNERLTALKNSVLSVRSPLTQIRTAWRSTLAGLKSDLDTYQPGIALGWALIEMSIKNIKPALSDLKSSWTSTLESMYTSAVAKMGGILTQVNSVVTALARLRQAQIEANTITQTPKPAPVATESPKQANAWDITFSEGFVSSSTMQLIDKLKQEANKPQNKIAAAIYSTLLPAGKLAPALKGAGAKVDDILQWLRNIGHAVPQFASGGIVSGPTLAMVGEYPGARSNPEVISPLSDLESMIDNSEQNAILRQILQAVRAGQKVQVVISEGEIARAAINGHNREVRRTGVSPLTL